VRGKKQRARGKGQEAKVRRQRSGGKGQEAKSKGQGVIGNSLGYASL